MFSDSTLNEIRERTDIVELIGEYVSLKKSGQGYMGLCPFHGEKTPSFHVHPIRQIFRCFGCQKGGNVFGFLQAQEGLNFPEAVKRLAKRAGVEIVEEKRFQKAAPVAIPGEQRMLEALDWAARYFHHLLLEKKDYSHALKYIRGRGISLKTIEKFRIGVAPGFSGNEWNTLMTLMLKRKYTFKELVDAGLVVPREGTSGDGYDRFRKRLMFPIVDKEGATIGFGARLLTDEKDQPKYLNSSESALFSKRKNMYGLYENQRGIRLKGEAVIVEGYMDVVGLYEAGVQNAVATMGTALTEEHCQALRQLTKKVVTVFDPDKAGTDASKRSIHLLLESRLIAKDLVLPDELDPDEYVQKEGADSFYALCEKAPRQITKYLKEIAQKGPLTEAQVTTHLNELIPILRTSRNTPEGATLWDDVSLVLKLSIPTLNKLVEKSLEAQQTRQKDLRPAVPQRVVPPAPKTPAKPKLHPVDKEFFESALTHPEEFLSWPEEAWKGAIRNTPLEEWLLQLKQAKNIHDFEKLVDALIQNPEEAELAALATSTFFRDEKLPENAVHSFKDVAERVRNRKKELEIQGLSAQVKLSQRLGNQEEQIQLLERLRQLRTNPSQGKN